MLYTSGAEPDWPDELDPDPAAVWRTTKGQRFQNYRARFTVLDAAVVTRRWISALTAGESLGPSVHRQPGSAMAHTRHYLPPSPGNLGDAVTRRSGEEVHR